ncbi:cell division protein FtsA [Robertmurraya massiliosenegalensis]|uniref:cell division protein FtsA n=1 Tax=Robertmurraya massiliosenegalensis TaxID=1287657 RepID=UPI000306B996|nr:cell division protein FtsA [Robertmurraya massiliosenegalensis]
MSDKKKLFALDIGTRSVVGIILEEHQGTYHVIDMLSIEHSERAMLDGQIHDVLSVSKIITEIKEKLEPKHGPLKRVSVAAAGRALKTERAKVAIDIKGKPMIQKEDILHLELSTVQKAQSLVAERHEEESSHYYYCVGYSVLYYRLDGEEIGSLIDQQGDEASVEIIATFLPKVVVESLISALHRAGLEMEALTLEPIAAINVLIPPSMRRLNVALVDIGAGTSDIALTDSGTVIAYGMVPVAGDEITEAISDQFLLDFPLAELAKREINAKESVTITDILGFEAEISKEEMIAQVGPAIDRLAASICDEIYQLNGHKSPKAVMLVGGGSLTPDLPRRIAERLNLPGNRVAIRGIDAITSLTLDDSIARGPELVTPIGIAIAAQKTPVHYVTVYVNEQPVRLFEVKKLTVGDCLLAAGIKMNKLYGRPGLAMIITLNGQQITIPGQHGHPPKLFMNGNACSFDDEVQNGDILTLERGHDGEKTVLGIHELLDELPTKAITINGKNYEIQPTITRNGHIVSPEVVIEDRDNIECKMPETIEEAFIALQVEHYFEQLKPFRITLNQKETIIPSFSGKLYKNGLEARLSNGIEDLDNITIEQKKSVTIKELADKKQLMLSQSIPVYFNGKEIQVTKIVTEFKKNGHILKEKDVIEDGDDITTNQKPLQPFIFQDLFNFVEIEMPSKASGSFQLLKNNEETTFFEDIEPGDHLEIVWPKTVKKD